MSRRDTRDDIYLNYMDLMKEKLKKNVEKEKLQNISNFLKQFCACVIYPARLILFCVGF